MTGPRATRAVLAWLGLALALTAAAIVAASLAGPRGLRLVATAGPGVAPLERRVATVDLRDLRVAPTLARSTRVAWEGFRSVRWEGFWRVPADGRYKLIAEATGPIAVSVDGQPVLAGHSEERLRGRVVLTAGLHAMSIGYEPPGGPDRLRLRWAADEQPLRDFPSGSLFASTPTAAQQAWARRAPVLAWLAGVAWALPIAALAVLAGAGRGPAKARRALAVALPALVVLYAAALRFDALVGRYSWEGPAWAIETQRAIEGWRPSAEPWNPQHETSGGDPYHYVTRARAMRGFYDADAREPLFPAWTRLFLAMFDDRIMAVHVASAACSTLLVLATYLLGAAAFSRAAGLIAALALAVDRNALWWSVEGFRDDAFALLVVLSALALLRVWRRPTAVSGALLGLAGAAACLTRITSLSFVLPALAVLLLARGECARARRRAAGVAALVLLALVGPFLVSCWVAYGDPLYAVNVHTKFYRSRTGQSFQESMGWLDYLRTGSTLRDKAETGLRGVTTYPFTNKWRGLDVVSAWLPRMMSVAAVAGLLLFLRSAQGRLLLLVLFTSLLPFAFTWDIPGGAEWRFTMHAYPLYLLAAGLALTTAAGWVHSRLQAGDSSATG